MKAPQFPSFPDRPKTAHPCWGMDFPAGMPYPGNTTYDEDMSHVMETIKFYYEIDQPNRITPQWFRKSFPDKLLFLAKYGVAGEILYDNLFNMCSVKHNAWGWAMTPQTWDTPQRFDAQLLSNMKSSYRDLVRPFLDRVVRDKFGNF